MQLFEVLQEVYPTLLEGLGMTVQITVLSLLIAMVLGIFVCLMNISNNVVLRGIAKFYIWLIRGTPMLVQAFYFYFAMPQLIQSITGSQFRITVFTASLVTLTLNAGAYISEIFRGSIESVNKGQMEAARSLGLRCQVHAEDHSSAGSADLSSFSGEPVHYHPEGFHDPLRHRFIRDHVPCEDLCGKNHGVLCDIHMGSCILPPDRHDPVIYFKSS